MGDKNVSYGKKILDKLREKNIRAELDDRSESISKKVKRAQEEKVNYMITIGDKEEESGKLAVRIRGDNKIDNFKLDKFVEKVGKEIEEKI